MNRWSALALALAVVAALALRLPQLGLRPLHNDEAVNAVKVADLWQHGRYAYDPDEYHGPTLHYATLPALALSGARDAGELNDGTLRLATVAFGVALVLVGLLVIDGLGRQALLWAATFTAVSPAMVFYSRYFIHEMLLVFFTALTFGAGWRYLRKPSATWALTAGAGLGLMFATKETFVLALAAMAAGVFGSFLWERQSARRTESANPQRPMTNPPPSVTAWTWNVRHLILAVTACAAVWVLFFSSFFTHAAGLPDSILTYLPWLKRAGGHSPHLHPWSFYLERLAWFHPAKGPIWSEALILALAAIGAGAALAGRASPFARFLAFYTVALTAIYSVIAYKTPWCLLGFHHGLILLAGVGAATLTGGLPRQFTPTARAAQSPQAPHPPSRAPSPHPETGEAIQGMGRGIEGEGNSPGSNPPSRVHAGQAIRALTMTLLLLAGTAHLAWEAWRASFVYPADRRNPYAYAQTSPDLTNLVQRLEGIAVVAPAGHQTIVKVIVPGSEYWPLPWSLRRFQQIGWYEQLPDEPLAPVMIVSTKLDARLDEKSDRKWIMAGLTELRPGNYLELYVELELWKKYVATLPRPEE